MRTIIEMVNHTRLDCALGSAAGMRAALVEAIHHAAHRSAFGKTLIDQPLMQNVLADLCVESEAATIAALRLARSYDDSLAGDEQAEAFKRIANPVLKYWICKREAAHTAESPRVPGRQRLRRGVGAAAALSPGAAELDLGGLGQRPVPRRPAHDGHQADAVDAFFAEVEEAAGEPALDRLVSRLRSDLAEVAEIETRARGSSSGWRSRCRARCCCASAIRLSPTPSARAASAATGASAFGTLPRGTDFERIIERHRAEV